jgi:hypothetical protein
MEEQEMAVKKATVAETMAKVAAKSTETKAEAPKAAEKKTEAPKATEKKAPAKAAEKKTAAKTAEKKAPAKTAEKKAPAKKAAPAKTAEKKAAPAKVSQNVYVEYAGGQVSTADLVARATAASGKKSIKALNVYYQPETNMVYYTADGDEGSFAY